MIFEDVLLLLVSGVGIVIGIIGFRLYRPGFNLHSYIASKYLICALVTGIASTIVIGSRHGWERALLHASLYSILWAAGVIISIRLDNKRQ